MEFVFSDRIAGLQPSAVREILKASADPEVIAFAAGNPSPETFPVVEMAAISEELFARDAAAVFQYGISEGYEPLRRETASRLRRHQQIGRDFDEVIIVSGAQQGVDLAAKVLLNEGDAVLCENPSFIGSLNTFASHSLKLVGIECDENGMRVDALEEALKREPRARLIYTIPTFQNPAGCVLPLRRREQMLELARKYNVFILEDDPYHELRYAGEPVAAIKSMDDEGRVVYLGSFSKTIAPGIRVGYVCAHRDIIAKLTVAKQTQDVHTNLFFQAILVEYMKRYNFDAHLEETRALYSEKLDRMDDGLRAAFGDRVVWHKPEGGLFLWCRLPDGLDAMDFCRRAKEHKVTVVPGTAFMVDHAPTATFRLNFSLPGFEQIDKGCARLGVALREVMGG